MIKNIKKQEEDILRKLHQTRDQELEPLLEKLDTEVGMVFSERATFQRKSTVALSMLCGIVLRLCNFV